jgi:DNA N-6-adenine-methyltransferase (Dam)
MIKSTKKKSDSDLWRSSPLLLNVVRQVIGPIDLDCTADKDCSVEARMHCTEEQDFLNYNFGYSCFDTAYMNPPFSKPLPFVKRFCELYDARTIAEGVVVLKAGALSNAGTGALLVKYGSAFCLWGAGKTIPSRLRFIPVGEAQESSPDFDVCLVYFGYLPNHAVDVLNKFGHAWRN